MTKPNLTPAHKIYRGQMDFISIGQALYGPSQRGWQHPLAIALDRHVKTIGRYASGGTIPPEVWPALAALLKAHAARLRKMAKAIA